MHALAGPMMRARAAPRPVGGVARHWLLDRLEELDARLSDLRKPSSSMPSVPSAAIGRSALRAIERGLLVSAAALHGEIAGLRETIRARRGCERDRPADNLRLTLLQLRADALFTSYDLISDAILSRADPKVGLEMAGCDLLLGRAMRIDVPGYRPPPVITYPDSVTRGGAINRARTRLPGDVLLGAALIRVSRESIPTRLSSGCHEVGHQLAGDLGLLEEAAALIHDAALQALGDRAAAEAWRSWTSELVADVFGSALSGGVPAVDGLQRVLSLPAPLIYRIKPGDPHPPGAVRVPFAIALARLVRSHPLLDLLSERFGKTYPTKPFDAASRRALFLAGAASPVASVLARARLTGLGQRSILNVTREARERIASAVPDGPVAAPPGPSRLAALDPLVANAVLGFARVAGRITPDRHRRLAGAWLRRLAEQNFEHSTAI